MAKTSKTRKEECRKNLLEILEGAKQDRSGHIIVHCILRSVSRSGMSRVISLKVVDKDGDLRDIGIMAADLMEDGFDEKQWGIKIGGCGMDMGFALVNNLSATLYRNEDGSYSHDGAYKLKSEWI